MLITESSLQVISKIGRVKKWFHWFFPSRKRLHHPTQKILWQGTHHFMPIPSSFFPAGISDLADYYKKDAERLHNSAGLGIRIAMNQNFIVAIDHGQTFDAQDGTSGTYVGLNFLF